jgi:hypothetical protein
MLGRKGSTVLQGYTSMGSVFLSVGLVCCLIIPFPTEVRLWSGIKKGPPRKLKFPEPEVLALEKALKTE